MTNSATFKNLFRNLFTKVSNIFHFFHALKKPFQKKSVAGLVIGTAFLAREKDMEKLERDFVAFMEFMRLHFPNHHILDEDSDMIHYWRDRFNKYHEKE